MESKPSLPHSTKEWTKQDVRVMRDARLLKQVRLVWRLGEELTWHRVSDLWKQRDYPYAAKPHYSDTLMNHSLKLKFVQRIQRWFTLSNPTSGHNIVRNCPSTWPVQPGESQFKLCNNDHRNSFTISKYFLTHNPADNLLFWSQTKTSLSRL